MKPTDPALAAALAAGERTASTTLRLGGRNFRTQMASWALDRAYGTDLPSALRAFSGTSAAQLDAVITGTEGQPAPALYGPWAPRTSGDAVRPGQSTVHGWGLGGTALDTFRGTIRSRAGAGGADRLALVALDGAERLRMPAILPRPSGGIGAAEPFAGLSNWISSPVWAVDHLLRGAGIHTCPPPRPTSILYASLHGGAAAGIGYTESLSGTWLDWRRDNAPFESAAMGGVTPSVATYLPQTKPATIVGTGLWFETWVDTTGAEPNPVIDFRMHLRGLHNDYVTLRVEFATGRLRVAARSDTNAPTTWPYEWTHPLLRTRGRFHIGWHWSWTTGGIPVVTPVVTDRSNVSVPLAEVFGFELPITFGNVYSAGIAIQQCRAEAFQVSMVPTRPTTLAEITQHGTWNRTARLDTPIDPLRVIPEVSGSAWDAITEIARCTLATAEFDADGIFRWRNRTRWTNVPTVPDVTVTSAREIASVTVSEEIDACRNHITVPWTNWRNVKLTPLPGFGEETASIAIAAGATLRREFTISEDRYDPRTPQVAEQAFPDCVGITTTATGSTGAHGVVDVRVHRVGGTVTLSLTNRDTRTVYYRGVYLIALTHDNGSNPVTILAQSQHTQSQGYYGIQHYAHDPKGWIQDSNTAVTLAGALREAGAWPIPVISDVEILPDPRIELGDVVRVIDHTGTRLNTLAWVTGIKTSGESGAVRQVLTLRAVASTGAPADAGLSPDPPVNPGALLST